MKLWNNTANYEKDVLPEKKSAYWIFKSQVLGKGGNDSHSESESNRQNTFVEVILLGLVLF